MLLNIRRNCKAYAGWGERVGGRGCGGGGTWKREIIYIMDDSGDESHFNVSLSVRDKVTRQCPQTTIFLNRKES